ncbi:MAG: FRG domain-containing protein [Planctomycetes bacterium]|nr:FRG domain-containing protein [Planctomycetota bacterium]
MREPRTIRVATWDEFLGHISDGPYANWAFRGQADASWPLISSLERRFQDFRVDRKVWRQQEERILRIFRRKAPNLIPGTPPNDDLFQWMALMEHHGAPTRLMDCTWSPYVAAHFAMESATGDAAVWAIDPKRVKAHACAIHGPSTPPGDLDPRHPGNMQARFLDGDRAFLWIGEPESMNRRLIAQSGTFLVPSVLDRSIDQLLLEHEATRDAIVRFVLPTARVRDRAMRQLYHMNVTQATLFPDLDGLARSMAYELEFHWDYDPHAPREPQTSRISKLT